MSLDKFISKMGYRDDSPFRDQPYIDINTPTGKIDMSNTSMDLIANGRLLKGGSGMHQFEPGIVREQPVTHTMPDGSMMPGETHGDYEDLELTDQEIAQYKAGGYVVEELSQAQGGLQLDSLSNYTREKAHWEKVKMDGEPLYDDLYKEYLMYKPTEASLPQLKREVGMLGLRDSLIKDGNDFIPAAIPVHKKPQPLRRKGENIEHIQSKDLGSESDKRTIHTNVKEGVPKLPEPTIIGYTQRWDPESRKYIQEPQYQTIAEPDPNRYKEDGGAYQDLELTDKQIAEYRAGGYVVKELPKAQNGKQPKEHEPVFVDPDDPRLKAYTDSLNVFDTQNRYNAEFISNYNLPPSSTIDIDDGSIWDMTKKIAKKIAEETPTGHYKQLKENQKRARSGIRGGLAYTGPLARQMESQLGDNWNIRDLSFWEEKTPLNLRAGYFVPNAVANTSNILDRVLGEDTSDQVWKTKKSLNKAGDKETIRRYFDKKKNIPAHTNLGMYVKPFVSQSIDEIYPQHNIVHPDMNPAGHIKLNSESPLAWTPSEQFQNEIDDAMLIGSAIPDTKNLSDPSSYVYDARGLINVDLPYYKKPTQPYISREPVPEKPKTTTDPNLSVAVNLRKRGMDSSFDARKEMAKEAGIEGYTGSKKQNIELNNFVFDNYEGSEKKSPMPIEEPRGEHKPFMGPSGAPKLSDIKAGLKKHLAKSTESTDDGLVRKKYTQPHKGLNYKQVWNPNKPNPRTGKLGDYDVEAIIQDVAVADDPYKKTGGQIPQAQDGGNIGDISGMNDAQLFQAMKNQQRTRDWKSKFTNREDYIRVKRLLEKARNEHWTDGAVPTAIYTPENMERIEPLSVFNRTDDRDIHMREFKGPELPPQPTLIGYAYDNEGKVVPQYQVIAEPDANRYKEDGGSLPQAQAGYVSKKIKGIESSVNEYLDYPQRKGANYAGSIGQKRNDFSNVDNIRHSVSGLKTTQALEDKGVPKMAAIVAANVMGAGHELGTIFKDKRDWSTKLEEAGQDMYNNFIGSSMTLQSGTNREKNAKLVKMSEDGTLAKGKVELKRKPESYDELLKRKVREKFSKMQLRGSIPKNEDGGFIDVELSDEEIAQYEAGGFTVEELPKFQDSTTKYNTPEYNQAYREGTVTKYNPETDVYQAPDLPEFTITEDDPRVLNAIAKARGDFGEGVLESLSAPQKQAMEWITGKQQFPSEAWGYNDPTSWNEPGYSQIGHDLSDFVMDAVTDPMNLIGAGAANKALKLEKLAAKGYKAARTKGPKDAATLLKNLKNPDLYNQFNDRALWSTHISNPIDKAEELVARFRIERLQNKYNKADRTFGKFRLKPGQTDADLLKASNKRFLKQDVLNSKMKTIASNYKQQVADNLNLPIDFKNRLGSGAYGNVYSDNFNADLAIKLGEKFGWETSESMKHMVDAGKKLNNSKLALPIHAGVLKGDNKAFSIMNKIPDSKPGKQTKAQILEYLDNIEKLKNEGIYLDFKGQDNMRHVGDDGTYIMDMFPKPTDGSFVQDALMNAYNSGVKGLKKEHKGLLRTREIEEFNKSLRKMDLDPRVSEDAFQSFFDQSNYEKLLGTKPKVDRPYGLLDAYQTIVPNKFGGNINYQDGGYIDVELSTNEIAEMRKQGIRVDEL